jgi:hypothetical protein
MREDVAEGSSSPYNLQPPSNRLRLPQLPRQDPPPELEEGSVQALDVQALLRIDTQEIWRERPAERRGDSAGDPQRSREVVEENEKGQTYVAGGRHGRQGLPSSGGQGLRPSEIRRKKGIQLVRKFGLVKCPRWGCPYWLIVRRGQQTSRCPRCRKKFWLCNARAFAVSDHEERLRNLIPWLRGRQGANLLIPFGFGDVDRFALTALRRGKYGTSSRDESPMAPIVAGGESSARPEAAKSKDRALSGAATAQNAIASPRDGHGGPRAEAPAEIMPKPRR